MKIKYLEIKNYKQFNNLKFTRDEAPALSCLLK